jgi:hypothetical protein
LSVPGADGNSTNAWPLGCLEPELDAGGTRMGRAEPGDPLHEGQGCEADAEGMTTNDHCDGGVDLEEGGVVGVGRLFWIKGKRDDAGTVHVPSVGAGPKRQTGS